MLSRHLSFGNEYFRAASNVAAPAFAFARLRHHVVSRPRGRYLGKHGDADATVLYKMNENICVNIELYILYI